MTKLDTEEPRRFVIGTAGHVDHGKTSLVRALTGVDTDRLPEEKRRGITIELGFAPWRLDPQTFASIIDVPGHRRLVHTMIAGAAGIELVLLVVAADEGAMPQTREHLAACELLGITRVVAAINKIDRVEPELAEVAREEVAELCRGRFELETVLCSAKTGEGVDALRSVVLRQLRATPAPAAARYATLSVDRAFSVKGAGSVVTGTLVRGSLAVGTPVSVVGRRGTRSAAARGLHVHDKGVELASAPSRVAVNLSGLTLDEIDRGDVVTTDPGLGASSVLDVRLRLLKKLRDSEPALDCYIGTARSPARLQILRPEIELEDGSIAPALGRLRLDKKLAALGGDRFVLRGSSVRATNGAVVGGGVVLDARPPTLRHKRLRIAVLEALVRGEASAIAKAAIAECGARPLRSDDLPGRFAVDGAAIERAAEKLAERGDVARIKEEGFVSRADLLRLAAEARALAAEHHRTHPLERGIRLETLRQKLGERSTAKTAQEAIRFAGRRALEGAPLVVSGDIAHIEGFVEGGTFVEGGPLAKVLAALADAGLKGMGEHAIIAAASSTAKETRAILAKLVRDGQLVPTLDQWFDRRAVDQLRDRVLEHFASAPVLTIAEFKAMSGLGRKQAIPLLELFDREGTSRRQGDDRVRGNGAGAKGKA